MIIILTFCRRLYVKHAYLTCTGRWQINCDRSSLTTVNIGRIEQIFNCNMGDNYKSEMMLINFVLDQNVELYFYSARLLAHWNNRPHFAQSGHIYPILNHRVSLLTSYMVIREARNTGTCIYTIFELTQPINDRPRQVCQPQPHIFGLSGGN